MAYFYKVLITTKATSAGTDGGTALDVQIIDFDRREDAEIAISKINNANMSFCKQWAIPLFR
jgi:hypothetical protein